jgi:hypothetical protein
MDGTDGMLYPCSCIGFERLGELLSHGGKSLERSAVAGASTIRNPTGFFPKAGHGSR